MTVAGDEVAEVVSEVATVDDADCAASIDLCAQLTVSSRPATAAYRIRRSTGT
ncbi:MAG: hypothetical protein ABI912_03355 [Actinomycetota bacterium]